MIHMQRSNSLPGPAYPSPPQSPGGLEIPARAATPATFGRSAQAHWLRDDHTYTPFLRPSESMKQDAQPASAVLDTEDVFKVAREPENIAPLEPLVQDVPHYTHDHLEGGGPAAPSTSLQELAHLVRLSAYQERKKSHSELRLHRSLVSTGLSARLARCGELAHRTLVDNFRTDDKKNFANLYNAIHDVWSSCDANRRYALLEPELDIRQSKSAERGQGTVSTFMDEIPSRSQETFLNFLCQVRTNPEFLASRIASLSPSEMSALTASRPGLEPIDSVLPFHSRSKTHSQSSNRNAAHIPNAVERLLSFQRHDPLSALIHTCFAGSAGPDSAEDLRRTDVWATVCARLITENRSGTDPFICSALNIWTAMRDWSGKNNMEWYLMKILEDGAFILEKAEDQAGTRIHVEPRNAKDSIAIDGFYDGAVNSLFQIIDDPGAGGIPEGAIELGSAILRKLDPKKHSYAKGILVSRWLFSVFLLNAVIHPESYGMMSGYHITEYGRQKILKEVAVRAQRLAVDWTWKQSASTPPEIGVHVDNIMDQFRATRSPRTNPKLLPARSITSLRETAEVRPYLVLSSADLVTMVNALFPEKRQHSDSLEKDSHFTGLRSTASSISGMSGISIPASMPSQSLSGFDTPSILSNSGSSTIFSEVTSREPAFDEASIATNRFSSTSISSMSQAPRFEDEGYKLRIAIKDMAQALGPDVTSGSCHPCAEQWAVLFVGSDGKGLSTQITDGNMNGEDTSSSDSEVEAEYSEAELDEDFQLLRGSILKLVEDYEIPQSLDKDVDSKFFSNITSNLDSPKKHHSRKQASSQDLETKSKYPRKLNDATRRPKRHNRPPSGRHEMPRQRSNSRMSEESAEDQPSVLLEMLLAAESQCSAQSDYVNAHSYWKAAQLLRQLSFRSVKEDGFVPLLSRFSKAPRDSIRRSTSAIEEYDAWMVWLQQTQERHDLMIEKMMRCVRALRDKMWYVSDVRNSAPYESARNVAVALKSMAAMKNNRYFPASGGRPRNLSRSSVNNFLLKTEAQILDILAASDEHGGPNKLSDEQSDKTVKWLSEYGIQNFCRGEERIHRFCMEIETCVSRLVGDSLTEGPVLWSSDLFQRDKRILDSGRQRGDLILTSLGTLSMSDENGRDNDVGRRRLRSVEMATAARSPQRDLRSMATRNGSQQSFDSSRWSMARSSLSGDFTDSQDYFGTASPVLAIDSAITFWSPFQTRVQPVSASMGNFRSGNSLTTNEHVISSNLETAGTVTKNNFLSSLKQSLLSLLISDLGMLVFARGSETDSWFSGRLGQDSMEWRERQEKKQKKNRVIEKKKSFHDLRSAQILDLPNTQHEEVIEPKLDQDHKNVKSVEPTTPDLHLSLDSSSASDTTRASSPRNQTFQKSSTDFPYKVAFKKLLNMFSVHPNPYAKLKALSEIEHLIAVSLTSTSPRANKGLWRDSYSLKSPVWSQHSAAQESELSPRRATTLEDTVDDSTKPRSQFIYQGNPNSQSNAPLRTPPTSTGTGAIVEVLQDLLREFDIRPKTLFRDLQFIAAFVPASILDKTGHGKAFWNMGLAALALKQDVCRTLIEIADEIVLHYTHTRQASSLTSIQPTMTLDSEQEVVRYTMQDAARMWTITAKEGDAVAERELAIFYLTHPELVERTTLPLTRPRETFKATVMEMHAGGGEGDRERSDPATMCVAYHWMELSARGGDELAKTYLKQREELNNLP